MTNVWILVGVGALVSVAAFVLIPAPGPLLIVTLVGTLIALGIQDARRRRRHDGE